MSSPFLRHTLGVLALACCTLGGPGTRAAQAADAQGERLFKAQCVACHGANAGGQVALQAPPLAGLDAAYLQRQLLNFRAGLRGDGPPGSPGHTMQAVARALPDEAAVNALAQHLATLRPVPLKPAPAVPTDRLNHGKALFAVCVACHGNQGEGTPALAAPRLNQLPSWYLLAQLQAFRSGARGAHAQDGAGQQMRQVAAELLTDDDAVQAVTAYIATLAKPGSR